MRKLKLQMQTTVDGFVAGPNGEMDWMVWDWDDELKEHVRKLTETVDTIVLGRKLAQGFIPHWASNPQLEGADKFNNTAKVVFTRTLDSSEWDNTVLAKGDLVEEITELKKRDGKDIIAYGGANFVSNLIKSGLIDEFHLFVNPVSLGNGMTLFKNAEKKINLNFVKASAFSCGIVVLHYQPAKS